MQASKWFGLGVTVVALAMIAMAQQAAPSQDKVIKHVPVKQTNASSGHEMFNSYCAVCHGTDGKGAGPASSALKVPPTDLTQLSAKNGENIRPCTFPACCAAKPKLRLTAARICRYGVRCSGT